MTTDQIGSIVDALNRINTSLTYVFTGLMVVALNIVLANICRSVESRRRDRS